MSSGIVAAGAVLWRPSGAHEPDSAANDPESATDDRESATHDPGSAANDPEVCLIHRPRHDDWSLPKGKVEPDEHVLTTAVREVREETGHRVTLGRPLPATRYTVNGRPKTVHFWTARADDAAGPWQPTSEVDEVRFLPAADALSLISYDDERAVVRAFLADPRQTNPVVLLRHTRAVRRRDWGGDDGLRPLAETGRTAATALIPPLSALGIERVVSSDALRCSESVRGFAEARGVELETDADLSEPGHAAAPERTRAVMRKIVADGRPTVVCSHRPVLPDLLAAAAESSECAVPTETLPPGGFHVLHIADGTVLTIDTH